jgi:hypoxanthine-guanine phosphoribosyltransferase
MTEFILGAIVLLVGVLTGAAIFQASLNRILKTEKNEKEFD